MKFIDIGFNWHYCAPYFVRHDRDEVKGCVLYIFHTPATLILSGERHSVDMGNVIIINKGEPHSIISSTDFYMLDWLSFSLDSNDDRILGTLPFNRVLEVKHPDMLSNLIMNCCLIFNMHNETSNFTLIHFLNTIFSSIATLRQDTEKLRMLKSKYPEIIKLRRKIFEEPQLDWNIDKMCKETNFSASALQKLYKLFFEISCKEDVISSRISHAKHLLITTHDSVADISKKSGFNSSEHFSRTFKKIMGRSPMEFRNEFS